jgi:hypothetical protein
MRVRGQDLVRRTGLARTVALTSATTRLGMVMSLPERAIDRS